MSVFLLLLLTSNTLVSGWNVVTPHTRSTRIVKSFHHGSIVPGFPSRRTSSLSLPVATNLDFEGQNQDDLFFGSTQDIDHHVNGDSIDSLQEGGIAETTTSDDVSTKSMAREIIALGLPALGGVVIDPIMSLVDTACVGQVSSLQLASMAPCTSICQFIFGVFYFLSATTTNLIAANPTDSPTLDKTEVERRTDYTEKVLSSGIFLALTLGTLVATILFAFSDKLLLLAGCSSADMLALSRRYLRIRAVGLPLVLVAVVLQGASLGRQDAWTPLKIFLAAGLFNVVGDVALTIKMGWGVTGAAVATVASQALAALYFSIHAIRSGKKEGKSSSNIVTEETRTSPTKGVALKWKGLPSKDILRHFSSFGLILLLRNLANMTSYSSMTRCAAGLGALSLAAHQVTLQVWWLIAYLPEPMCVAAQSLIARDLKDRSYRIPKLLKVLYSMGLASGSIAAVMTGLTLMTPIARGIVADSSVRSLLFGIAPWAMLAQICSSMAYTCDNICVGLGDVRHVPFVTVGALSIFLGTLFSVARQGMGVETIWRVCNIVFVTRFIGLVLFSQKLKGFLSFGKGFFRKNLRQARLGRRRVSVNGEIS